MRHGSSTHSIRLAGGLVTWAVISGIAQYVVHSSAGGFVRTSWVLAALQLAFLAGMLVTGDRVAAVRSLAARHVGFVTMVASAFAMALLVRIDFLPIYTIIWIAYSPHLVPQRAAYGLLVAVMVAWYTLERFAWGENGAVFSALLYGTFHFFALLSSESVIRATQAQEEAQLLNQELMATQQLLAEASRQGERTRIARDLHDLLGHHLTALTINLQVAERQSEGDVQQRIEQCHALSRLLLADVREAVSTLRENQHIELREALSLSVQNLPGLDVELRMDEDVQVDDVNVAQSLLRCVQEAVTNTLRHSGATQCWIHLWAEQGHVLMRIRDNGTATNEVSWGNGLTGMRERIEKLRGRLTVETVGRSLQIDVAVPVT
ncbi:MAG: sensor histidine kinase [Pseudomonadota bacterium]